MTENDYLIAWGLYAFAALGCLLVWCRLTYFMWCWLHKLLRVLVAVLLFSPTISDPVKEKFAPAVAIMVLDLGFKIGNNAWRAVSDLLMYTIFSLCLYVVSVLVCRTIELTRKARRPKMEATEQVYIRDPEEDQPFGSASDGCYCPAVPRAVVLARI